MQLKSAVLHAHPSIFNSHTHRSYETQFVYIFSCPRLFVCSCTNWERESERRYRKRHKVKEFGDIHFNVPVNTKLLFWVLQLSYIRIFICVYVYIFICLGKGLRYTIPYIFFHSTVKIKRVIQVMHVFCLPHTLMHRHTCARDRK